MCVFAQQYMSPALLLLLLLLPRSNFEREKEKY
jgi:hypothetical protein